jgi:hypothetical protein
VRSCPAAGGKIKSQKPRGYIYIYMYIYPGRELKAQAQTGKHTVLSVLVLVLLLNELQPKPVETTLSVRKAAHQQHSCCWKEEEKLAAKRKTGGWAVSTTAPGMTVEKQLQFCEHIRNNCRPWDSNHPRCL